MPIRDVLFPMLSHPVATTADSVERAAALAAGLGAHIVGVTFELDIRSPVGLYAHPAGIGGMFAAETRRPPPMHAISSQPSTTSALVKLQCDAALCTNTCLSTARRMRWLVSLSIMRGFGILLSSPSTRKTPGRGPLSRPSSSKSGRPVLLLPETTTRQLPSSFDRAAVAWDHSRPAARAIADALPMLQAAKHVHVVTVVDEKHLRKPHSGVELCKHLARHGVEVTFDEFPPRGGALAICSKGMQSSAISTCW